MTDRGDRFDHPLIERYAGREMARLFSPAARHGAWRELWIALAHDTNGNSEAEADESAPPTGGTGKA